MSLAGSFRNLAILFGAPLVLLHATPALAELSSAERHIVETVDARMEENFGLLERLVVVNSGTRNFEGVRAVAEILRPEFEKLGFTVEWIDQSAAGRAGHLFARHEGEPGSTRMLLIAHLDTVFEKDSPFQGFSRTGQSATGPGVEDDKGGIIVILSALQAMKAAGTLEGANIVVALTGDEEDAGSPLSISRKDLVEAAEWADVALDFESLSILDGKDMGVVARRSSNTWTLRTSGREGHSSGIFSETAGNGAIYEMARILSRFRDELPEENLTFNVGLLAGGTTAGLSDDALSASANGKTNIIPPVAVARGDLRTISPEQTERVVAKMQTIVAGHMPGTGAEIAFDFRYPPMPPTAGNHALLERLNEVNDDLGLERMPVFPPAMRGAGDINFVADKVDGLAGLGANGMGSHAPGETVDLTTFPRQATRAAILMSRLTQEATE